MVWRGKKEVQKIDILFSFHHCFRFLKSESFKIIYSNCRHPFFVPNAKEIVFNSIFSRGDVSSRQCFPEGAQSLSPPSHHYFEGRGEKRSSHFLNFLSSREHCTSLSLGSFISTRAGLIDMVNGDPQSIL